MTLPYLFLQQGEAWHRQGLYMGMHWAWWLFWIATFLVLGWAFWRLFAERRETEAGTRQMVEAEEILRQRFARGEIDEEELLERMRALHAARVPRSEQTQPELSKEE
ncbi:MAG: SHOCT domain-containing protein [Candidatus Longimicrobiales bacterium M2_2A_002]